MEDNRTFRPTPLGWCFLCAGVFDESPEQLFEHIRKEHADHFVRIVPASEKPDVAIPKASKPRDD